MTVNAEFAGARLSGHTGRLRVLVVSNNAATGIVAAAIAERCGYYTERTEIDCAEEIIKQLCPDLVIADDCYDALADCLAAMGDKRPKSILLGLVATTPGDTELFDAVVRKPLTMDGLQPLICRLLKAHI